MTFHKHRAEAMESHEKRQHMYARGGEVREEHPDVKEDRALIREMVKKNDLKHPAKRKDGGGVEGRARGGKSDRPKGGKTTVNVIVPPGMGGGAAPMPPRPMMPPPGPPPGGGMPPPGAMPPPRPPMAGMGPMPPGGPPMPPRARGGKIDAGAASGVGRIEKAEGGIKGRMIERE